MTQWLTRRDGSSTEPVVPASMDRSGDRQLSSRTVPPKQPVAAQPRREQASVQMTSATAPAAKTPATALAATTLAAAAPAENDLAMSTPSLVRRSRRPPPDPAPKLQQNQQLAADTSVANPYVEQQDASAAGNSEQAATPTPDISERNLQQIIASASRCWQTDPASAASMAATHVPASETASFPTGSADLKFVQPNLDRIRTSPGATAAASSVDSSDSASRLAKSEGETGQPQSAAASIPRREDLLARHDATSIASHDPKESPEKPTPPSSTPATEWIAKKAEPGVTSAPDPSPAAPTLKQAEVAQTSTQEVSEPQKVSEPRPSDTPAAQRSIVAEMFAAQVFSPRNASKPPATPATRPAADTAEQAGSSLARLPDSQVAATSTAAKTTATSINRSDFPTESVGQPSLLAGATTTPDSSASLTTSAPNAAHARAERLAASHSLPDTEQQNTTQQRDALLARSKPQMPPPPSVSAYYHRGVMPPSFEGVNAPQLAPAKATELPNVEHDMAGGTLAPLIDANAARPKPSAPSGRQISQTGTLAAAQQPAAPGTWLAAYQKLVKNTPPSSAQVRAPATATRRSISSDDPN